MTHSLCEKKMPTKTRPASQSKDLLSNGQNTLHDLFLKLQLELSCCENRQKIPNQETGLGNRGRLKVLNDTKLVLNEHMLPP